MGGGEFENTGQNHFSGGFAAKTRKGSPEKISIYR